MVPSSQIWHSSTHTANTIDRVNDRVIKHVCYRYICHTSYCYYPKIIFILVRAFDNKIAGFLFLYHLVVLSTEKIDIFQLISRKTIGVKEIIRMLNDNPSENIFLSTLINIKLPLNIGTCIPAILQDINAFVTTFGRVVLPATQVIPRRTLSYCLQIRAAMIIHRASSPPTSQSMMKYLDTGISKSLRNFFLRIYISWKLSYFLFKSLVNEST